VYTRNIAFPTSGSISETLSWCLSQYLCCGVNPCDILEFLFLQPHIHCLGRSLGLENGELGDHCRFCFLFCFFLCGVAYLKTAEALWARALWGVEVSPECAAPLNGLGLELFIEFGLEEWTPFEDYIHCQKKCCALEFRPALDCLFFNVEMMGYPAGMNGASYLNHNYKPGFVFCYDLGKKFSVLFGLILEGLAHRKLVWFWSSINKWDHGMFKSSIKTHQRVQYGMHRA